MSTIVNRPKEQQKELATLYKGPKGDPVQGTVVLKVSDPKRVEEINSRQDYRPADLAPKGEVVDSSAMMPEADLNESVRTNGIIEPMVVVRMNDGSYVLTAGNRRAKAWCDVQGDADALARFEVYPATGTDEERMVAAMTANGVENLGRKNLKGWECADFLYRYQQRTGLSTVRVAAALNVNDRWAANMIRVRKQLVPKVWEAYVKRGDKLPYVRMLALAATKPERQEERFKLIAAPEFDEFDDGKRRRAAPEPEAPKGPSGLPAAKVKDWKASVKKFGVKDPEKPKADPKGSDYARGFLDALRFGLKEVELYDIGETYTLDPKEYKEYVKAQEAAAAAAKEAEKEAYRRELQAVKEAKEAERLAAKEAAKAAKATKAKPAKPVKLKAG